MAMKLFLVLCVVCSAQADVAKTSPLSSVISLLNDLKAKVTKEGEAEQKAFEEFSAWCKDASTQAGFDIITHTKSKESLEATIQKAASDSEVASTKIASLAADISTGENELKKATTVRDSEAADFRSTEAELADVVDTLSRAIQTLSREMQKNPAAFAQVSASAASGNLVKSLSALVDAAAFSTADKEKLLAMVQEQQSAGADEDDAEMGAPAASVYTTHSTNIVDVLEDLKEKAEEELASLRKAETNARHNFEMLHQSLEDEKSADEKDFDQAKSDKASAAETKASSEGDLAHTVKDLATSKESLATANAHCLRTATDHGASVQSREEELKAIGEALKVLADTTTGAGEQTYSFVQLSGSSASGSGLMTRADLANMEVVNMIKKLAAEQHSAALAQLASRIAAVVRYGAAAGEDPFSKVRALISDLIARLEKEAGTDATEKAYCDEQLAKTAEKRGDLNADISKLTSKIDKAAAKSAKLKDQVHDTQAALASLAKQQAEMDQVRRAGHAAYVQAKSDLELGLQGVRKAVSVLREYYGSSALLQNTDLGTFMQQPAAVPDTHSKAEGAGNSIIGILEVVESDFAKNLATEETQESDASAEYDQMSQRNAITKTTKDQDVTYQTKEFKSLDKSIAELSSDRSTADTELSAVMEYLGSINKRCIAAPQTYEDRKGRRAAEVAGLKEALAILEEETALVQRKKHGLRQVTLA